MRTREDRMTAAMERWQAIPDPTTSNLTFALLDQKVAGTFRGKDYAYSPIINDDGGYAPAIAVANEDGCNPVLGLDPFKTYDEAALFCDGMNKHIGLPPDHAAAIICSTMGGFSYRRTLTQEVT